MIGDRPAPARYMTTQRTREPVDAARADHTLSSAVLRRQALGDEDDAQGCWVPQTA
jgi:hypothetical protein